MTHYDRVAAASAGSESDSIEELAALLTDRLSHKIDDRMLHSLFEAQLGFRNRQNKLIALFEAKKCSPDEYLVKLTSEMERLMEDHLKLLGAEDFYRVYGEAGLNPGAIVDRSVFFAERSPRS